MSELLDCAVAWADVNVWEIRTDVEWRLLLVATEALVAGVNMAVHDYNVPVADLEAVIPMMDAIETHVWCMEHGIGGYYA